MHIYIFKWRKSLFFWVQLQHLFDWIWFEIEVKSCDHMMDKWEQVCPAVLLYQDREVFICVWKLKVNKLQGVSKCIYKASIKIQITSCFTSNKHKHKIDISLCKFGADFAKFGDHSSQCIATKPSMNIPNVPLNITWFSNNIHCASTLLADKDI